MQFASFNVMTCVVFVCFFVLKKQNMWNTNRSATVIDFCNYATTVLRLNRIIFDEASQPYCEFSI